MNQQSRYLCTVDDIKEGESKGFNLTANEAIQDIFVVRRDNHFFAYINSCPHTGIHLNWQPNIFLDNDGEYIQCAMHGAQFEINSGKCIWGPCLHQSLSQLDIVVQNNKLYIAKPTA